MKLFKKNFEKGFTLIELLIVIAILGILAAGILVAIDPLDKIYSANDSKVINDVSGAGRASEAYAVTHNGFYPAAFNDLVTAGELKRAPVPPSGYPGYNVWTSQQCANAGGGTSACTDVQITGQLKSKKYLSVTPYPLYFWRYDSNTGKSCAVTCTSIYDCPCP